MTTPIGGGFFSYNKNLKRLVRQYFPKGCDFTNNENQEIILVQNILSNRPR